MDKNVDLANTSLSFPDLESGHDIEAERGLVCIVCNGVCKECQDTCPTCEGSCTKNICG